MHVCVCVHTRISIGFYQCFSTTINANSSLFPSTLFYWYYYSFSLGNNIQTFSTFSSLIGWRFLFWKTKIRFFWKFTDRTNSPITLHTFGDTYKYFLPFYFQMQKKTTTDRIVSYTEKYTASFGFLVFVFVFVLIFVFRSFFLPINRFVFYFFHFVYLVSRVYVWVCIFNSFHIFFSPVVIIFWTVCYCIESICSL